MSDITSTAHNVPDTASEESDTAVDVAAVSAKARKTLFPLLFVYLLGTLAIHAFNLVFHEIGADLDAGASASLITAIPGVVLGIVCFVFGSLGDFISLRRMTVIGIMVLAAGSIGGFLLHGSLLWVIVFRVVQTVGFQTAGSAYLVIVARYLKPGEKLLWFGLFTASYQLGTAAGVLIGGWLGSIDWSLMFLVPLLGLFTLPVLMRNLPDMGTGAHVDVPGFALFGAGILFLTLFFSLSQWWMVAVSVALFILFVVYIAKAREPFMTTSFFTNRRWATAVLTIVIIYFINFAISPMLNALGGEVYGMGAFQVALVMLVPLLLAACSGALSGRIAGYIGRFAAIVLGCTLMAVGLVAMAFASGVNMVAVGASLAVFYIGMAMLYSPVSSTVLDALGPEEYGRGVGMNDLALQGGGSVGIAVFGGYIAVRPFSAVNATTLFLVFALIAAFAVVWTVLHRRLWRI